jgi:esterase/lipase superfamily enzyme
MAAAIADLRFGLDYASRRYGQFLNHSEFALIEYPAAARLLGELADERASDVEKLDVAAKAAGLSLAEPTLDEKSAGPLLGMGYWEPRDAAAALARVQRAENSLGRMAEQLASLLQLGKMRGALERIGRRIRGRKESVREVRTQLREQFAQGDPLGASGVEEADGRTVDVWFATNRARAGASGFGRTRADKTSYGRCRVFIPDNRRVGSLGGGLLGRIFRCADSISVTGTQIMPDTLFWADLRRSVESLGSAKRQGLVFLHGYNTSFADAARRAAQLKIDLDHAGPAAFFAWPSFGSQLGYSADEASIDACEPAIEYFLTDFARRSGVEAVHIIAHSMGNRGLLRAMHAIANAAAASAHVRFGQIFLAAPDVDTQLFRNLAAAYPRVAAQATLYVTDNDRAIGLSRSLHRYHRVGLTPPITIVPGIDTVDASGVNLGISRHGYAAEMRPVLSDMFYAMRLGLPPAQRHSLRKPRAPGAKHWEFAP